MFESKVPASDGDAGIPDAGVTDPDSELSGWLGSLPVGGPALGLLAGVDPGSVSAAERVDLLVAWNRQLSHVQAMTAQVVAAMADLDNEPVVVAGGSITDPVAEEIGCALNMSAFSGHLLVDVSRTLVTRLPNVLALLQAGQISLPVAKVMVEEVPATWSGPTDPAAEVEQAMLARLTDRTPAQVRRSAKRVVQRVCPADTEQRAKAAVRGRGVSLFAQPDAMMTVCALLPAADAQYVYATIDQAARRRVSECKAAAARGEDVIVAGIDATRADIIVELAIRLANDEANCGPGTNPGSGSGNGGNGQTAARPVRTVAVVIDALTALGLADNPGEIPGYGPIPASMARELAADGQWVRWLTDPDTGALLDAGGRKYRPSAAMRNFIIARDQFCRFPGCQALATGLTTEIDHADEFNHANPTVGGQTTRSNLGACCKKHHQYKTGGLWDISVSNLDGSCEWTSRTGHRYRSSPDDIFTPETNDTNPEPDPDPDPDTFGDQLWPDVIPEPPEPEPGPQRTDLEQLLADALCG